ncbi:hypothetical protein IPH25_01925 [bacterium]|nr:MAG: hypothetical protein IPG37_04055 [bacterium]QQR62184.1 MAG: hypothetical protein IPH25_01925 [bacterium]QQR63258.1 MAG: hypothetical protein IPH67_02175 [bacterium]
MNKKCILLLTLTMAVFAFCKDGESKEEIDKRIKEREAIFKEIDSGYFADGTPIIWRTCFTIACKGNQKWSNDGSESCDRPEKNYVQGQFIDIKDYAKRINMTEQLYHQCVKKMAVKFVTDAGQFCNENILNNAEGYEGLVRLWLNYYDQALIKEQLPLNSSGSYDRSFSDKREDNFWDNKTGVIDQHDQSLNPVAVIKLIENSKFDFLEKSNESDNYKKHECLRNGKTDQLLKQYVLQELKERDIKPYTTQEIANMDADELERRFPSNARGITGHDTMYKDSPTRIFSITNKSTNTLFPPVVNIITVLQRFFGLPRVFVN